MADISDSESISSYAKLPIEMRSEEVVPFKTCTVAGDNGEYVVIGEHKYFRHELMQAFGGTFNPGLTPYPKRQFGNAAAIGLVATHMNIFVLGLYFIGVGGITAPNMAVGLFIFMGGLTQFLAGVMCLIAGSDFGALAFTSYGAFWLSFGVIFIPGFGIQAAYAEDPQQLNTAIGLVSVGWAIFTFGVLMCVIKATLSFFWTVLTLELTIILLAAGFLSGSPHVMKAGGAMGVINAAAGWFEAFAGIATRQNSYLVPKEIPLQKIYAMFSRKK